MPDIFFAQEWLASAGSCSFGAMVDGNGVFGAATVGKIR
jgi:hypothetical protein